MNRELVNIFNQNQNFQDFNNIKISIASPDNVRSWSFGEIKNQRQLIIELLNLKKMDCFAQEFLAL